MIMNQGRVEYGVIVKDEANVKNEADEPQRTPDRRSGSSQRRAGSCGLRGGRGKK
jgi:hypothetical protein